MAKPRQQCAYLYADGHAVVLYEKDVQLTTRRSTVEYTVVHEKYTDARLDFIGRIVFSRFGGAKMFELCRGAWAVEASSRSLETGSNASRDKGIAVGSLKIVFKDGTYLKFLDLDVLSGKYTYQPEHTDAYNPDCRTWGTAIIAEVRPAKKLQEAA